jgi:hypothetical protein
MNIWMKRMNVLYFEEEKIICISKQWSNPAQFYNMCICLIFWVHFQNKINIFKFVY